MADGDDGPPDRDATDETSAIDAADVVLELPDDARDAFKDPLGTVFGDVDALRAEHDGPVLAVGDVVTYHFEEAGHPPAVAFVDGKTRRETAPEDVRATVEGRPNRVRVANPPATITAGLLSAIADALATESRTTVVVDGEEDLAAVPAVLAAPGGATVVYGQPDEGMVAIPVTTETRAAFRDLLGVFDGDVGRALDLLGV